ncbi:reticulon-like protein B12 isoform X1 [Typha angustifolia]|uniref:reticulon-like protein B12 isoform X1 n=1 Tax=Typha angustifolia TaxID=59011 RepID=UPI003C2E1264
MESHSSSLHGILGGGLVPDVVLWRRKTVSIGVLVGTVAAWVFFYKSGYTLISFLSNVLLLLLSVLFIWAKAAGVLNRPLPPIPKMTLSEEVINEAAAYVGSCMNMVLSAFEDIALGKDSKLFYRVAACLLLISIIGRLTDFLTLSYIGLVVILTIPALIEKYRECIHGYIKKLVYAKVQTFERIRTEYFDEVKKWILEQKKLV